MMHTAKCKVKKSTSMKTEEGRYNTKGLPCGTNDRRLGVKELRERNQIAAFHAAGINI